MSLACFMIRAKCIIASLPGLPTIQFLHTASDQKLDCGKAWERGYMYHTFPLFADLLSIIVKVLHAPGTNIFTLSLPLPR